MGKLSRTVREEGDGKGTRTTGTSSASDFTRWGAAGKGPAPAGTSLAAYPTSRTVLWEPVGEIPPGHPTG